MCYKQKCKVVSLNLAHPVYLGGLAPQAPDTRRLWLGSMKLSWCEAESKAQDRVEWRSIVGGLCSGRS